MIRFILLLILISCATNEKAQIETRLDSPLILEGDFDSEDKPVHLRSVSIEGRKSGDHWNRVGNTFYRQGDLLKADHYYRIAITKYAEKNECPVSLNNLGLIAYKRGMRQEALELLTLLHTKCPTRHLVSYNLIALYLEDSNFKEAKRIINELPKEIRVDPAISYFEALTKVNESDEAGAMQLLEGAVAKKVSPEFILLLAKLKHKSGKYIETDELLSKVDIKKDTPSYNDFILLKEENNRELALLKGKK